MHPQNPITISHQNNYSTQPINHRITTPTESERYTGPSLIPLHSLSPPQKIMFSVFMGYKTDGEWS